MAEANKGRASREVVQALINDMNSFNQFVSGEVTSMMNKTNRLGESWKDSQYTQFSNFMTELTESLKKDLAVLDEAAVALQKKLNMY
ncbi:MAG: WXG100 family type VII secretion target [Clostridia bacterium]|nr:WXG100 family type VII secretion target [Clostridia bacterium]